MRGLARERPAWPSNGGTPCCVQEEAEAFEALACIHDGGVVHGDPSTNNLMIQRMKAIHTHATI